jgi:hypothetical protein
MIKLFITAIDSNEDGTALTLFEDYQIGYENKDILVLDNRLSIRIADKIEEVELINEQATSPF